MCVTIGIWPRMHDVVCAGAADSWRHALLECNLAKCVWALENESIVEFLSQNHYADAHTWVSRDHQLT